MNLKFASLTTVVLGVGCAQMAPVFEGGTGSQVKVQAEPGELVLDPGASPASCRASAVVGPLFSDATEAWGLGPTGLKVVGNRLSTADLDGDGYPDLLVHAIATNRREQQAPLADGGTAPRLLYVLMNRPGPGGARVFVDETKASGLFQVRGGSTTELRSAQLAVAGDVDNDGDLDIFSGTSVDPNNPATDPGDRSEVLLNDGHGHFSLAPVSDPHPAATSRWATSSATFTDFDRDGRLDLFVGFFYERYGHTEYGTQAQLYRGQGDGTFTQVTAAAGLSTDQTGFAAGTNSRPLYGVTSCDLDGDGAPELLGSAYGRQWNLLYRNNGGSFVEVGRPSGYAGDENHSYQDNQFFDCYCTAHPTQADCLGVNTPAVVCPAPADSYWNRGSDDQPWRSNGNTFTTLCSDLDDDGDMDLYNAEIHHWWAGQGADSSGLLHNESTAGALAFSRPPRTAMGMEWPHPTPDWNEGGLMAAAGDLDDDGPQDVLVAASDYPDQYGLLFHQRADHTFENQGAQWGFNHACVSGLTVADFDRDGDLDVLVGSGTARDCSKTWKTNEVHLYENRAAQQSGQWLEVRLVGDGVSANRSAIGAKVTVETGGHSYTREVSGGYGHFGMQNDTVQHFGLGGCDLVDRLTVRWPDAAGTTVTYQHVPANHFIELRQGSTRVFNALP